MGDKNSLLSKTINAIIKDAPITGKVMPVMLMPQAFIAVNSLFLASEANAIAVAMSTPWGAM